MTAKDTPNQANIRLSARWDHPQVPTGQDATRGLLIDIEVDDLPMTQAADRPPVNLALVIDRSGSMSGAPLHAARQAAIGVAHQLAKHDRLTVVAYDHSAETILDGVSMDTAGKQQAEQLIELIQPRGSTALSAGWLQGARAVARVMDEGEFKAGHVVLLSDGCANQGECNPARLAELAANLAERNVTSTCIGIGAHYSLLQLTAIAEAGQGEIHQSNEPEEIIEVVAGEIGEQTRLAARNFTLTLQTAIAATPQQLTHYREHPGHGRTTWTLGNLVAGQTRQLALLLDLDAQTLAEPIDLAFTLSAQWERVADGKPCATRTETALHIVPTEHYNATERDKTVAEKLAKLWMARQGYEAMHYNELGDFDAASRSIHQHDEAFAELVANLPEAKNMIADRERLRARSSMQWDGISKKEAMLAARKATRLKGDFRRSRSGRNWIEMD